ncbi:MAG: hypothetical protein V4690_00435 [Patescibacteria group bacterium]
MTKQEARDFFNGRVKEFLVRCSIKGEDLCARTGLLKTTLGAVLQGNFTRCHHDDLLSVAKVIFPPADNPKSYGDMERAIHVIFDVVQSGNVTV